MASAEPIKGVWAVPPAGVQGAEPPVGGQGAKPPEAERLFAFACLKEAANLTDYYVHAALYCKENIGLFLIELSLGR